MRYGHKAARAKSVVSQCVAVLLVPGDQEHHADEGVQEEDTKDEHEEDDDDAEFLSQDRGHACEGEDCD